MRLTRGSGSQLAITFVYHDIASRELKAARDIASEAGIEEHRFVRLPDLRETGDTRLERLAGVPPFYIPGRNGVFYSMAASYAEEVGADLIVGGHNRDDVKLFKDASPSFFLLLQRAFWRGSPPLRKRRTRILLPLSKMTKAEVVKLAPSLNVPLELTWSCHRNGRDHCWECEGCMARIAAFAKARVNDPLRTTIDSGKIQ